MKTPITRMAVLAAAALWACTSSNTSPTGTTLLEARGTFADGAGKNLVYPVRVAPGADGTIWVSDATANRVVGLRDGSPAVAITGIERPLGLAVAGDALYVGSAGRHTVEKYDLAGRKAGWAVDGFVMPNAIAVAPDGIVYVVDSRKDHVVALTPAGALVNTIGATGDLVFPVAVAADANRLYVGDQGNHRVVVYDRSGAFLRSFGGEIAKGGSIADYRGKFTSIGSLALSGGELLVLDSAHSYVQAFDTSGSPQGIFGYAGDCGSCTRLALGIAATADGRVLATDPENHRVVTLSTERR